LQSCNRTGFLPPVLNLNIMSLNILVTGANGQLGNKLKELVCGPTPVVNRYFFTDIADLDYQGYSKLDITCSEAVEDFVGVHDINVIINCAAYTNVERAEDDFATANLLNNVAVGNLAHACAGAGATLIHISTDYVFNGKGHAPYKVDETPDPIGVYGKTKYAGELSVLKSGCKSIIIRTAWLYSEYGNNFVKTMIKLTSSKSQISVVNDQTGTPTYAGDLAGLIFDVVEQGRMVGNEGIYHFTDEGVCTWYDFAVKIAGLAGTLAPEGGCVISPCTSEEFPSKVTRPTYSVLDKSLVLSRFGYKIPQWEESLSVCMRRLLSCE
jgi:dTDP-4-dehydrorhamnose reductase